MHWVLVALLGWALSSVVLTLLIARCIRLADLRAEQPPVEAWWWEVPAPRGEVPGPAQAPSARAERLPRRGGSPPGRS